MLNTPILMKQFLMVLLILSNYSFAQNSQPHFFNEQDLTLTGVYYYPEHWDESQWDRDFKNMAAMGFEFTHFAEFAWAQLEPKEGEYDFDWLDKAVALADKYGLKVVMCTSTATPPIWLVRKHPEVLKMNEDGTKYDHGARQHASFSNEYYREYSKKLIEKLAEHYGNDQRIIGWQLDNEPWATYDYNREAQKRFRTWLKDKYKTIEALNQAWGTKFWSSAYQEFSQINMPQYKQWGTNLYQRLDHHRFSAYETASFLDEQAVLIRKYAKPDQWITTNFIPQYEAPTIGMNKELDFISYTRYMVYGSYDGIGEKGYRLGEYTQIAMANDYFRPLSPYYGVMELQPGQVNWGEVNSQPLPGAIRLWLWHVFAGGSQFTCTYRYRAPIYGYEQYHYGVVGTDGVTPTRGGTEFAKFIKEIEQLRSEKHSNKLPAEYLKRKTAILYDPDNGIAISQNKQNKIWDTEKHILKYYKALKSFGSPVDFIRSDADFNHYPTLIVPAYQQMSKELISKLEDYTSKGGSIVMSVRSGHQNELGHLWEAPYAAPIYNLIGSEIEFYDLLRSHASDKIEFEGKDYSWTSWGDILKPNEDTAIWAHFKGDFYSGKAAITNHEFGKGSVTYVGVDSDSGVLENQVLKKVFTNNNIPIESYPEGILVEYRDGFGIAMNYSDKKYQLELPKNTKIIIGSTSIPTAGVLVWKL